jgi:hypothetical protein
MKKLTYLSGMAAILAGTVHPLFNAPASTIPGTKCSGTYYEGINSLYIDCYDALGNLVAQDENHYEFSLEKVCSSSTFADMKDSLENWLVPRDTLLDETQL